MTDRLKNRVAIVTGGGRSGSEMSIGRAIALLFAREGATVGVLDLNPEAAAATVAEIEGEGGSAFPLVANVVTEHDCARAVGEAVERVGALHILVNNVGITSAGRITEVDEATFDRVMAVNLKGALLMTKHALPAMKDGGAVVNISSIATIRPRNGTTYAISKAALEMLTRATAVQYGGQGVRANAVLPGEVWTELMARAHKDVEEAAKWREERRQRSIMKTEGNSWNIAYATLFLASDEARWITGQSIVVDGGSTQRDERMG